MGRIYLAGDRSRGRVCHTGRSGAVHAASAILGDRNGTETEEVSAAEHLQFGCCSGADFAGGDFELVSGWSRRAGNPVCLDFPKSDETLSPAGRYPAADGFWVGCCIPDCLGSPAVL